MYLKEGSGGGCLACIESKAVCILSLTIFVFLGCRQDGTASEHSSPDLTAARIRPVRVFWTKVGWGDWENFGV